MQLAKLDSRENLQILLDRFYAKVRVDDFIGPIFNDVAKVNWDEHLPKIYDFWDSLLFGSEKYHGRPFPPHIPLKLELPHFKRWLELFIETVDEGFEGPKAEEIKTRALNIARNFLQNLAYLNQESKL